MTPSNIPIRNYWADFNLNRHNASFSTFFKSRANNLRLRNYMYIDNVNNTRTIYKHWVNQKNLANLRWYIFKNVQSPSMTEIQVVQDKINLLSVKSEKRLRSNYQRKKNPTNYALRVYHISHLTSNVELLYGCRTFSLFQHLMFLYIIHIRKLFRLRFLLWMIVELVSQ